MTTSEKPVPPVSTAFRAELLEIVSRLSTCLRDMIMASPQNVRNGADLRRALGLDRRLSTQILRVAFAERPDEVATHIPGSRSMSRFLQAAHADAGMQLHIARTAALYQDFVSFVERIAGDRPTFDAMASTLSASEEDIESLQLQHRRSAFRAVSHLLGAQVKTFYRCSIFGLSSQPPDGLRGDFAHVQLFHQVHRLNPQARLMLFQSSVGRMSGAPLSSLPERGPIDETLPLHGGANLFPAFSSNPLPTLRGTSLSATSHRMEILRTDVGRAASVDVAFGYVDRNFPSLEGQPPRLEIGLASAIDIFCPTEKVVADLLIHESLSANLQVSANAYANLYEMHNADPADWVPLPMTAKVSLEKFQPSSFGRDDHPNYAPLVLTALEKLGWSHDQFRVCRLEMDYPLLHSKTLLRAGLPRTPQSG